MQTDLYTKFVLTVIAGCLLWLCVAGMPSTALAQVPSMPKPPKGENVYIAGVVDEHGNQISIMDHQGKGRIPVSGQ